MPDRIRFGVLGAAKIADKVVPAMQKGDATEVTAIASREAERARTAAARLHLPRWYGSYEELLASDEIDAVYIPLPNHMHVQWAIRSLEAGKHVLCEKPLGQTAAEAEELAAAAARHPDLAVMEAFMYRFHPQWRTALRWIEEGEIGELRTVHSHFAYSNLDPGNVRNRAETGGGGLLDIGCYDVSLSRFLFKREPERVVAQVEIDPEFGVDRLASGILDFGSGTTATFTCATQLEPYQRAHAFGTQGRIEIEVPFNTPPTGTTRVLRQRGLETREISFRDTDQYTLQGDAFARAILRGEAVPTPIGDAVANLRVLDAIRASGADGGWVTVVA